MGRVHKKKLVEYTEAAESDDLKKSKEKSGEDDGKRSANALLEKHSNDGSESDEVIGKKSQNAENESEDCQIIHDENEIDMEKNGGKRNNNNKRRSSDRTAKRVSGNGGGGANSSIVPDALDSHDSDDEPLNGGGGGGPSKKARKSETGPPNKSKQTAKADARGRNNRSKGGKSNKSYQDKKEYLEKEEKEYEVKEIVDHKVERGVSLFLIRWKGYTKDDDTWEPEDTLSCPELIEKFKKKQLGNDNKSPKKGTSIAKKSRSTKSSLPSSAEDDPDKEWEVDKIIDYAEEKNGRIFRIRWKGFGSKYDTWEPEEHLSCDEIINKFMKRMKAQENVTFKELREEPKKTKRLVNETAPRTSYHNPIGRKSRRTINKKRIFYGDSDE